MIKRAFFLIAVFALALTAITALPRTVQAQDGMIVCDSTLITLLYVAESDYGFKPMMDVSTLEKGQFKALFEAMMMDMMESTPEAMMESTPETMMESTPEAMMESVVLAPGKVADENEACTTLRAEIEAFLLAEFKADMMMK